MAKTKIVFNACFGGFGLSEQAVELYIERKGLGPLTKERIGDSRLFQIYYVNGECFSDRAIPRSDPVLVQIVEELGGKASGSYANLQIAELEPGTKYRIDEYDGNESVMTIDDYEWSTA